MPKYSASHKRAQAKYYQRNKSNWTTDEKKAVGKAWREKNREHLREYNKKWQEEHPEHHKENYWKNPEAGRAASIKWRKANPEKSKAMQKACKQSHIDRGICPQCQKPKMSTSIYCEYHYICTLSLGAVGTRKKEVIAVLVAKLESQGRLCAYTKKPLILGVNASLDHIIPRSRDRSLENDPNNIEWVDLHVNFSKRDQTRDEFVEMCYQITDSIPRPETAS